MNKTLNDQAIQRATKLLENRRSSLSLVELEPIDNSYEPNGLKAYTDYNTDKINKTINPINRSTSK